MSPPIRAVLDTNVFVAALLKADGKTSRLLLLWKKARLRLIFSAETIRETLRVLEELGVSAVRRRQLEILIRRPLKQRSIIVRPKETLKVIKDESDNRFLEVAVAGKAEYLVTNNRRHFQDAGVSYFRGVRVVSIGEFLKIAGVIVG